MRVSAIMLLLLCRVLIIASDGLWDVADADTAVRLAWESYKAGRDAAMVRFFFWGALRPCQRVQSSPSAEHVANCVLAVLPFLVLLPPCFLSAGHGRLGAGAA